MQWKSTQMAMGSCEQQKASTLASQSPRWHWPSLITALPEVQQELVARSPACCIYNALQRTYEARGVPSSQRKQRRESVKCKLKRQYVGTQGPFKSQRCGQVPLDLGDSLKRWEECSRESWALRLRHCRAQTPSLHPSNHAACFYSRDATGQWHKMALQNFPNFTSGPKSTTVRFKLHWKAYDSRFQRI